MEKLNDVSEELLPPSTLRMGAVKFLQNGAPSYVYF
jgi:hypothetical protein